jgi:hypothetical protein
MSNTKTRPENRGCRPNRVPRDHYQEVTDRIIAALEAGTPPWRKPWDPDKAGGPAMPRNAVTGHKYRGINVGNVQAGGRTGLAGPQGRARHDRIFLQAAGVARRYET